MKFHIGDTVCSTEDLPYVYKNMTKFVKKGHALIVKSIMGDRYILERFNKTFIVSSKTVASYPLKQKIKSGVLNIVVLDDNLILLNTIKSMMLDADTKNNYIFLNKSKELEALDIDIDFLVSDIRLDDNNNGINICKQLRYKIDKILIVSSYDDYEYISQCIEIGVDGYLLKDNLMNLPKIIKIIIDGGVHFPSKILNQIIKNK